jgi:hypothetical protein
MPRRNVCVASTKDVEARPADTRTFDVSGTSNADVWIAGTAKRASGVVAPLIEQFDGSTRTIVKTPIDAGELWGISAIGANDVWAVGRESVAGRPDQPLALHWVGSTWTVEPVTVAGCDGGLYLSDVDAPGPGGSQRA